MLSSSWPGMGQLVKYQREQFTFFGHVTGFTRSGDPRLTLRFHNDRRVPDTVITITPDKFHRLYPPTSAESERYTTYQAY